MKQVTGRTVDTYVTPDRTDIDQLSKRQRQVSAAFESLGVAVRQGVEKDRQKADAALNLKRQAANAKIKLALSDVSQDSNRLIDYSGVKANEYWQNAVQAIDEIGDGQTKAQLLQTLDDGVDAVLLKHQQTNERESNITAFGAVVADTLQTEYTASDLNGLIDEHKGALGADTLPSIARIAISAQEVPAIEALLERDDLHPETIASLTNAKGRILAAKAKEVKADKTVLYQQIKLANSLQDRGEQYDAKLAILENYDGLLSENQRGNLQAELLILQEELKSEELVKLSIGDVSTRDLADPKNLPEGVRALPIGDIKQIQDREFNEAFKNNDLTRIAHLTEDPTDLPRAAGEHFGSLLSDMKSADFNNLSQGIINRWNQARTLESVMGPAKMEKLLGAQDYAKYQIVRGIADQEALPAAISRLQEYEAAIANGNPIAPEGFTQMKRNVEESVIEDLNGFGFNLFGWSVFERDVNAASVRQALTPYFKVWGATGLSEDQMKTNAKEILGRTAWSGMVGGRLAQEHFESIQSNSEGPIYSESPEELFEKAIELQTARFRALQPGLPEELTVTPLGVDRSRIVFTTDGGFPVINGIVKLEVLSDLVKANTETIKQRVLREHKEKPSGPTRRQRK